ncbi:MBOAT family protein [Tatlockia micdadei]|uniref:MBOAT family O-acyltransferase n=1 Tax=Legionella micdadei TaxID=451 RepID=UPI00156F3DBF|nr:MBOAT family O-acyltransferase [Legionella micdadei]NSL17177.1 MBOAT family protein [Legionella micdadei]
MLFTTPIFLFVFLPLFLLAYYFTPSKGQSRNFIALVASILFFSWGEPIYVFLLLSFVFIDYVLSRAVAETSPLPLPKKKILLFLGISINVFALILFKYTGFIIKEVLLPLNLYKGTPPESTGPLLLGISFITFHKISYLVDSYQGRANPPRNFLDCALYIFLFPQLIAGPIIRYHDIGSQIHQRVHTSSLFLIGCFRFCVGLAKKLLIADQVGLMADKIFALPINQLSSAYAWTGSFAYMLQIYFDFSGYSDMAIGLGYMMGFKFPENFNRPYIAKSITEFWRRWHISLSNWMRLYLYIPLGGNRVSKIRTYLNLWIVFLISGLWHGANWTFLAWGAYYGFFLSMEKYISEVSPTFKNYLPPLLRFLGTIVIVLFGWVLFRSPNISYAFNFISRMLGLTHEEILTQPWGLIIGNRGLTLLLIGAAIAFFNLPRSKQTSQWSYANAEGALEYGISNVSMLFLAALLLLSLSVMAMLSASHTPFLYFRF